MDLKIFYKDKKMKKNDISNNKPEKLSTKSKF